jgi:hypothetical protein
MLIAYLTTARNLITSVIDTFTMFPYIIPGFGAWHHAAAGLQQAAAAC